MRFPLARPIPGPIWTPLIPGTMPAEQTATFGEDTPIGPHGATLEDGYRCAEICDAIVRSHDSGERQEISYRTL